jgi:hypothetical protein
MNNISDISPQYLLDSLLFQFYPICKTQNYESALNPQINEAFCIEDKLRHTKKRSLAI